MKRTLRKVLRFFGYDLKKFKQYHLVHIKNLNELLNVKQLKAVEQAFEGEEQENLPPEMDSLVVTIRTCIRANRNVDKTPRFHGLPLNEATFRCVRSLVTAMNQAQERYPERKLSLIWMDDRSDTDAIKSLEDIFRKMLSPWTFRTTQIPGQGESLYEQFSEARGKPSLCYFVEDDFLHEPSAIWEMWDFYRQIYAMTGNHLVIHPQEMSDFYGEALGTGLCPAYIVKSNQRRWRTIDHSTHVLFTAGSVVESYWQHFENTRYVGNLKMRHLGAESRTTDLLYEIIPGFSPIEALAVHTQFERFLPPFYNWGPLWEEQSEQNWRSITHAKPKKAKVVRKTRGK